MVLPIRDEAQHDDRSPQHGRDRAVADTYHVGASLAAGC